MIFTDLYKSPKSHFSRFRHSHHNLTLGDPPYDADLVSRDKTKQKEAVKRHLQSKVRNDWAFTWPVDLPEATNILPESATPETKHESASTALNGEIEGFLEVASVNDTESSTQAVETDEPLDSGEEANSSDSDAESVYSIVDEDARHWRPRLEWASELSEDELPYNSPSSPFKFDNPDSIGHAITKSKIARKARRRREVRKEMAWNDGLACFEARRNAWTGAKVVRVRPNPATPTSPLSPTKKGLFWRTSTHPNLSPTSSNPLATSPPLMSPLSLVVTSPLPGDGPGPLSPSAGQESDKSSRQQSLSPKISQEDTTRKSPQFPELLPVETLLPIPPPLLPPANPMRASISPALYNSIYEKVVVHSLQPSCPINLGDMLRACVAGWKRDGEWPPRPAAIPEPPPVVAVKRHKQNMPSNGSATSTNQGRRMSFSFLVGRGHENGGGSGGGGVDNNGNNHNNNNVNTNNKEKTRRESTAGGEEGSGGSNTGKAIRRSLQKVLGIGHSPTMASVADGHTAVQQH